MLLQPMLTATISKLFFDFPICIPLYSVLGAASCKKSLRKDNSIRKNKSTRKYILDLLKFFFSLIYIHKPKSYEAFCNILEDFNFGDLLKLDIFNQFMEYFFSF